MIYKCILCNWDMFDGKCANWTCHYEGRGRTLTEIEERCKGYKLGQLDPPESYRVDDDNGWL